MAFRIGPARVQRVHLRPGHREEQRADHRIPDAADAALRRVAPDGDLRPGRDAATPKRASEPAARVRTKRSWRSMRPSSMAVRLSTWWTSGAPGRRPPATRLAQVSSCGSHRGRTPPRLQPSGRRAPAVTRGSPAPVAGPATVGADGRAARWSGRPCASRPILPRRRQRGRRDGGGPLAPPGSGLPMGTGLALQVRELPRRTSPGDGRSSSSWVVEERSW